MYQTRCKCLQASRTHKAKITTVKRFTGQTQDVYFEFQRQKSFFMKILIGLANTLDLNKVTKRASHLLVEKQFADRHLAEAMFGQAVILK
jgi:hypothetical protein